MYWLETPIFRRCLWGSCPCIFIPRSTSAIPGLPFLLLPWTKYKHFLWQMCLCGQSHAAVRPQCHRMALWLFSGVQCITAAVAPLTPFYLDCCLCPPPLWKTLEGFSYGMDEGIFLPFLGTCALWVQGCAPQPPLQGCPKLLLFTLPPALP